VLAVGAGEAALFVTEQFALDDLGEIAPQLTARNSRSRRRLTSWIVCATISLPVPLSPVMNTVAPVGATRSTVVQPLHRAR
jgi:hypothetical protein